MLNYDVLETAITKAAKDAFVTMPTGGWILAMVEENIECPSIEHATENAIVTLAALFPELLED
ncbi:hypothetical protein [Vibrio sp. WXL210]|uniref:hypothetical protein n=1 Tax=Vibrio sp. WXL210 TaxID=3450709 RepID=UPI003EC88DD0